MRRQADLKIKIRIRVIIIIIYEMAPLDVRTCLGRQRAKKNKIPYRLFLVRKTHIIIFLSTVERSEEGMQFIPRGNTYQYLVLININIVDCLGSLDENCHVLIMKR